MRASESCLEGQPTRESGCPKAGYSELALGKSGYPTQDGLTKFWGDGITALPERFYEILKEKGGGLGEKCGE